MCYRNSNDVALLDLGWPGKASLGEVRFEPSSERRESQSCKHEDPGSEPSRPKNSK